MNDSEKDAVLFLQIAQDLKVSEATIGAETVETLYSLIVRQQAEIDRLNIDLKAMRGAANLWKAEVQRIYKKEFDNIEIDIETVKSATVKEFAEKLKDSLSKLEANSPNKTYKKAMQDMLDYYFPKIIDDVVKEMGCNDG